MNRGFLLATDALLLGWEALELRRDSEQSDRAIGSLYAGELDRIVDQAARTAARTALLQLGESVPDEAAQRAAIGIFASVLGDVATDLTAGIAELLLGAVRLAGALLEEQRQATGLSHAVIVEGLIERASR